MDTKRSFISIYKVPFITSLTVFVLILAIKILKSPLDISMALVGAFFGTFVLDLEYFIYAYFFEPQREFSKTLVAFMKHGDILHALTYVHYNEDEIKEKSLNNALFQIILIPMSLFMVSATTSFFIKAIILSVLANSTIRLMEAFYAKKLDEWFWIFKAKPSKEGFFVFIAVLVATFIACLKLM